jgi:hypothetical protein
LIEQRRAPKWYSLRSPEDAGGFGTVVNALPTTLFMLAQRQSDITPFSQIPQQSAYVKRWSGNEDPKAGPAFSVIQRVARTLLPSRALRQKVVMLMPRQVRGLFIPGFDPRFFVVTDLTKTTGERSDL